MKYKYNGQWYDVSIKALDSMPVGTIVEYDGQASDIPTGWEQVTGQNKIKKTSETTPTMASVVDTYSTSTQDAYSCNYVNNMIISNWDANNSRGYIKYPDGTAICYGLYNPDGGISVGSLSGKAIEISLPITLSNALYSVNLTKFSGGNGYSLIEESANSPAVDKFYVGLWNNSSSGTCYVMGYYWQVVGRWK